MFESVTHKSFDYMWRIWRFTGIFPPKNHKWFYNFYAILLNIVCGILSPISIFVNLFFVRDIEVLIRTLQFTLYTCTLSFKQFMIYIRMSQLETAKSCLKQLDQRASVNKDELRYLRKIVKQCRFIIKAIQLIFVLSFLQYFVSSLVKNRPFMEGWLSWYSSSSRAHYIISLAVQVLPIMVQMVQNTASDAFPPVSINLLNGQIRALCMRVARIGNDTSKTLDENYTELKLCINDHRNIISLFNNIKPTISQTVLVQLIITGNVLCLTVFFFLKFNHGSIGQLLATIFNMLATLTVSLPVCYFGNSLMEETRGLTTAIYKCNWIDQTIKFRKTLIIFMQHSQREHIINAGGLITINLQTFIAIIRYSFSLFTLLERIEE
ncbi:odorant receptor 2a-like [Eupeodes corollae]|uniref:odorant receptor 2a-like n=1 Tax=Eupeodes corollae TaxID=290404 RepID=UPI0024924506|nr:odorant receptor 2a-like [Eupeodes corollae]